MIKRHKAKIPIEDLMRDSITWFYDLPVDVQNTLQENWILSLYMNEKKIKKKQVRW